MKRPIDWASCGVIPANGARIRVCAVKVSVVAGLASIPNWNPYAWVFA